MPPAAANPAYQLALAAALGAAGVYLLLPRPRGRSVAVGTFLCTAAACVAAIGLIVGLGRPLQTDVGDALFWLFSAGAVVFGTLMVTQRNPGRGAIAFAFVILSVCGLFLLLAAPFIMAATIIIYAGAIIVTFLFVLMLSHAAGPSDENDRTREPLMGSLAGFGFAGLVLFTILKAGDPATAGVLPTPPLTTNDREQLVAAYTAIDEALASDSREVFTEKMKTAHDGIASALGDDAAQSLAGSNPPVLARRFRLPRDPRQVEFLQATKKLAKANVEAENKTLLGTDAAAGREAAKALRDELLVFMGNGRLPARNVANLGYMLYSEHILAVEMAGTLLLVATVGAVAVAGRRKAVPA